MGRRCPHAGDEWIDAASRSGSRPASPSGPRSRPARAASRAPRRSPRSARPSRPSAARSRRSGPRSPGSTPGARRRPAQRSRRRRRSQGWSDAAPARGSPRVAARQPTASGSFGAVNETLFRFMSEHCSAWADREKARGPRAGRRRARRQARRHRQGLQRGQGQVRRDPGRRRREEAEGDRRRRPLRARHRAAREPAHRQPAARPLGPPGRSRPLQVLPVARRRPDAHLRLGPHGRRAAEARPAGRRGHHASLDQQGAREGAAEGRGAQLRRPQVRAQVRRRDERSAQGDLRAPHRHHGARRRQRDGRRHAPRRWCRSWSRECIPPNAYAEQWNTAELKERDRRASSASTCRSTTGPPRKASPTRRSASGC